MRLDVPYCVSLLETLAMKMMCCCWKSERFDVPYCIMMVVMLLCYFDLNYYCGRCCGMIVVDIVDSDVIVFPSGCMLGFYRLCPSTRHFI